MGLVALAVGAFAAAAWFAVEALAGTMNYTIQGNLCRGVLQRLENQQPLYMPLSTCSGRHDAVYRAYILELGVALASVAVGVRWLIRAFRKK